MFRRWGLMAICLVMLLPVKVVLASDTSERAPVGPGAGRAMSETVSLPFPSQPLREELAQLNLELALANIHPRFSQLWLELVNNPGAQRPELYAEIYATIKTFRENWYHLSWDERERLQLATMDLSPSVHLLNEYRDALTTGALPTLVATLRPHLPHYQQTRQRLITLLRGARAGDWPRIPTHTLHPGVMDAAVPVLKHLLQRTGDLSEMVAGEQYDAQTQAAVRAFQRRHGLDEDAIVGPRTWSWLGVSPQEKAVILARSMLRRDVGSNLAYPRYILVNIPEFRLHMVQENREVFSSRVIVGQQTRQTPILASRIASVVLNPPWNVPRSILSKDIVPKLAQDPSYLQKEHFDVLNHRGETLDPSTIPWSSALRDGFPYQLRQRPGDHNALGRYKFYLPNDESIYLHSTPGQKLFDKDLRAMSSGCIRVEAAADLANLLLQGSRWDPERVRAILTETSTKWLPLTKAVPVFTVYWRSWLDTEGRLQFRDDIYGFDLPEKRGDPQVMASLLANIRS